MEGKVDDREGKKRIMMIKWNGNERKAEMRLES